MDYKLIFSQENFVEAVRKKGYDLRDNSVLNSTHFASQDDAVDEFLQNSFDAIYELIRDNRGNQWAELFFEDMSQDLTSDDDAIKYKAILKEALVEQVVYIWDNGDSDATADKDDRSPYAPKAVKKLWGNILRG